MAAALAPLDRAVVARRAMEVAGPFGHRHLAVHELVGHRRRDLVEQVGKGDRPQDLQLAGPAHDHVAPRMLRGIDDRARHDFGRIDGVRQARPVPGRVARMLRERGADRARLDQGDRNRFLVHLQFDAEGIGKALHRVLRRVVGSQDRPRQVRVDRADVDDRTAFAGIAEMARRDRRAMDDAPVIGLEDLAMVFHLEVEDLGIDADPGIVHPGIDPAEAFDGLVGQALHVAFVAHVHDRVVGRSAARLDLAADLLQRLFVAGREHDPRPPRGRHLGSAEAVAGRGPGDDHDLVLDRLEFGRSFQHRYLASLRVTANLRCGRGACSAKPARPPRRAAGRP